MFMSFLLLHTVTLNCQKISTYKALWRLQFHSKYRMLFNKSHWKLRSSKDSVGNMPSKHHTCIVQNPSFLSQ